MEGTHIVILKDPATEESQQYAFTADSSPDYEPSVSE